MSDTLTSRLSGFHKLSMVERHEKLSQMLGLDEMDLAQLQGISALQPGLANQMIENAVGTFSLPLGLGLNLQINGRDFLVPMAVSLGFGILFATVITLVLVPEIYLILDDITGLLTRRRKREAAT